jgi:hypothetical protein
MRNDLYQKILFPIKDCLSLSKKLLDPIRVTCDTNREKNRQNQTFYLNLWLENIKIRYDMNKNIFLLALICGMIFACRQSNDKLIPVELQCEYQTGPVGIDVSAPRFSWQLFDSKHVRGQAQTAYHILVASSPDKLTEAATDVWNSGKIDSPQSVLATFGGKKLQSSSAYFWKVRIYDKDGNTSATVYIPASQPEQITESGNPLNIAEIVIPKGVETGYAVVEVTSGNYEFAAVSGR